MAEATFFFSHALLRPKAVLGSHHQLPKLNRFRSLAVPADKDSQSEAKNNTSEKTQIVCPRCKSTGSVLCLTCDGSGLYLEPVMQSQGVLAKIRCIVCYGDGHIMCPQCLGGTRPPVLV